MQPPSFNIPPLNQPVTLVAVCIFGVLVLAGLRAIYNLEIWLLVVLIILVIGICVATVYAVYKLPQLGMESPELLTYLNREFSGFRADVVQPDDPIEAGGRADEELERRRLQEYEDNRGLFLVHTWRPSNNPEQTVDIVIRLHQHIDAPTRPDLIATGEVASVEFEIGEKFLPEPVLKKIQRKISHWTSLPIVLRFA